jgi:hypothetical protein
LKSTNRASPSKTDVYFRSNVSIDPIVRDDQYKNLYFEDSYDVTDKTDKKPAGAYSVWVEKIVPKEVNICF